MSVCITPGMNDKYPNGSPFRDLRTTTTKLNGSLWLIDYKSIQRPSNDTLANYSLIPPFSLDSLKAHWRNISRLLFPAHCSDQFAVENPASPSRYLILGFHGRRLRWERPHRQNRVFVSLSIMTWYIANCEIFISQFHSILKDKNLK